MCMPEIKLPKSGFRVAIAYRQKFEVTIGGKVDAGIPAVDTGGCLTGVCALGSLLH